MMRRRLKMFSNRNQISIECIALFIGFLFILPGNAESNFQCLKANEQISFDTQSSRFGIGLQVTNRPTHQVITRIFYMFLKEVLHYTDVKIIPIQYANPMDANNSWYTLDYVRNYNGFNNVSMINLEVWMPYTVYKKPPQNIYSAGASMFPGRFGWFVPKAQISTDHNENSLHYNVFNSINNTYYNLYLMDDHIMDFLINRSVEEYMNPNCAKSKCATLIAESRNDSYFIESELNESFLNVIWLGSKFKDTIKELAEIYETRYPRGLKRFIVLHWIPSDIIDAEIKFSQMTLPRCEDHKYLQASNCRYELTSILKFYSRILVLDQRMLHALRKFYITNNDLEFIQRDLSIHGSKTIDLEAIYNEVACNWLSKNEVKYKEWILQHSMATLQIGGIFPINVTNRGHINIIRAARKAIEDINANSSILPDYNLDIMINDGHCKFDMSMKAVIHYYNVPNVLGILGPACSETIEPIAGISKHLDMIAITYSADGGSFVDREQYPYFFRTIGSNTVYVDAYMEIMLRFGWNRVSTLTEDGLQYIDYMSRMENKLKFHNYTLAFNRKFSSNVTAADMREHLIKLKDSHSRIIIAELHNNNAALAICEAIKLGMTLREDYVWFLPSWLPKDFQLWQLVVNNRCSAEEFSNAIEGHFSLRHSPFGQPDDILPNGQTVNSWLTTYGMENPKYSDYVGFVYDAVWVYALAAHKLLRSDANAVNNLRTKPVADRLAKLIWETDFHGLSGKVIFGQGEFGGSRIINVDLLQWKNKTYFKMGNFKPNIVGNGSEMHMQRGHLSLRPSEVFPGQIPEDGRYDCTYSTLARLLNVSCDSATMIFSILICLLAILLMSLISFYFWKQRYNRKVKHSAQIMKMFGIDLLSPSRNKKNTLDKWEIPRENVVVNRKIGQGVFGTVYGGEARLGSDDWTAVAVKTLRTLMSADDRLDFLAEAETMKKLNHKNIVKLLAVCLQVEPIYTIMEFMLYGDLKTYLLARRTMVKEKATDESDISSKRLTMYAMDIAQGLAYLAEQKYVHRDIACRNCLVNSQRVVKIGDFGMARPTFESDYYCFNRKGTRKLFPVRWMPPETLSIGLFTSASDMWSFGVVLYEIITFGSNPYQGLSNFQVLDYVRNGNTLQIPEGIKPQLEGLLKACWSQDSSKRPTALEVVDYIMSYPRLLTPSLDCPETAFQMTEIDSDEIELLLERRKTHNHKQSSLDILPRIDGSSTSIYKENSSDNVADADSGTVSMPMCSTDSCSATTPDGYSIMSPLLMHQVGTKTSSAI